MVVQLALENGVPLKLGIPELGLAPELTRAPIAQRCGTLAWWAGFGRRRPLPSQGALVVRAIERPAASVQELSGVLAISNGLVRAQNRLGIVRKIAAPRRK